MNYILVQKEQLEGKGFDYAERIPDGRVILPITVLKVLTGISDVQIISKENLDELISSSTDGADPTMDQQESESETINTEES